MVYLFFWGRNRTGGGRGTEVPRWGDRVCHRADEDKRAEALLRAKRVRFPRLQYIAYLPISALRIRVENINLSNLYLIILCICMKICYNIKYE
jgi:hypothetical protein